MYVTADLHGDTKAIINWINSIKQMADSQDITLVVLGDAGLNYNLNEEDRRIKQEIQEAIDNKSRSNTMIDILFVRGNHECRPENIESYKTIKKYGDEVFVEDEFPSLLFLKDGGIYTIEGQQFVVIGGGFSEDFLDRLINGYGIWVDQELSVSEFSSILENPSVPNRFTVLSHMPPSDISQKLQKQKTISLTEKKLQEFLERYQDRIEMWLFGHYHTEREFEVETIKFQTIYNHIRKV